MTRPPREVFGALDLTLGVRELSPIRAVLSVRGCLDSGSAPLVQARIRDLVAEGRVELVCDLTGVTFLNSSGLSALISGLALARARGGFLRLAGLGEQVARDLRLSRVDHVFELYPDTEAALA